MLTLEEIKQRLKGRNLKYIHSVTGLSYDVIWRIANDKATQPSYYTVKKLSDYLEANL